MQTVIDENKIVKIVPETLDGFFKVCFILDKLGKTPENANMWLVYLLSYVDQELYSYELFQLLFCLDFLYPRIELKKHELNSLVKKISEILNKINTFAKKDGSYQSDKKIAPLEDTRYSLFVINIIEDLIQDIIFYYKDNYNLAPITQIFKSINNIDSVYKYIKQP